MSAQPVEPVRPQRPAHIQPYDWGRMGYWQQLRAANNASARMVPAPRATEPVEEIFQGYTVREIRAAASAVRFRMKAGEKTTDMPADLVELSRTYGRWLSATRGMRQRSSFEDVVEQVKCLSEEGYTLEGAARVLHRNPRSLDRQLWRAKPDGPEVIRRLKRNAEGNIPDTLGGMLGSRGRFTEQRKTTLRRAAS